MGPQVEKRGTKPWEKAAAAAAVPEAQPEIDLSPEEESQRQDLINRKAAWDKAKLDQFKANLPAPVDPLLPKDPTQRAAAIEAQNRSQGLIPLTTENGTEWVPDPANQIRQASEQKRTDANVKAIADAEAARLSDPWEKFKLDVSNAITGGANEVEKTAFALPNAALDYFDPERKLSKAADQWITPALSDVGEHLGMMIEGQGEKSRAPGLTQAASEMGQGIGDIYSTGLNDPRTGAAMVVDMMEPTHQVARGVNNLGSALESAIQGNWDDAKQRYMDATPDILGGALGVLPMKGGLNIGSVLERQITRPREEMAAQLGRIGHDAPNPSTLEDVILGREPAPPAPAPVAPVAPSGPVAFSLPPEAAKSKNSIVRNADRIAGGAVGATIGGAGEALAAPGDGSGGDNGLGGAVGGGILGSFIPRGVRGLARVARSPAARASFDERVAARAVRNMLRSAGIKDAEAARASGFAKFGDKPASVADLSQEAIGTAAGTARLPGKTGEAARLRYDSLVDERAGRVARDIGDATGLSPSTVTGDIAKMADEAAAAATPEYDALRQGYPTLISSRLDQMRAESPTLASSVKAVEAYKAERLATKKQGMGDFEFWDLVKRDIDHKEQALIDQGVSLDDLRVRNLENARSELVAEMDRLVPDQYAAARLKGGEAPRIRAAFEEGKGYLGARYRPEEVAAMVSELTGAPLTAAQSGMIRTIMGKAEGSGAGISSLRTPAARKQLAAVFGDDVADQIQRRLEADATIIQNASRMNPNVGSATAQAEMGGGAGQKAAALIRAARSPFDAILNSLANMGYSKAQRDLIGEMLLGGISDENLERIFRKGGRAGGPQGGIPTPPASPPPSRTIPPKPQTMAKGPRAQLNQLLQERRTATPDQIPDLDAEIAELRDALGLGDTPAEFADVPFAGGRFAEPVKQPWAKGSAEDTAIKQAIERKQWTTQALDPRQIIPTQDSVFFDYAKAAGRYTGDEAAPIVVKQGDQYFVADGHHRLMAQKDGPVRARVIDLDAPTPKPPTQAGSTPPRAEKAFDPDPWYHAGSLGDEMSADAGELGLHIGSEDAAKFVQGRGITRKVKPVISELRVRGNFAETPDIGNFGSPYMYLRKRADDPRAFDRRYAQMWAELDQAANALPKISDPNSPELPKALKRWRDEVHATAKRHDVAGWEYINYAEGGGDPSRVVFDPSAVSKSPKPPTQAGFGGSKLPMDEASRMGGEAPRSRLPTAADFQRSWVKATNEQGSANVADPEMGFKNYPDLTSDIVDVAEQRVKALISGDIEIKTNTSVSNVSPSAYIEVDLVREGEILDTLKIRVSDHADRYGSDATVRVDGRADELMDEGEFDGLAIPLSRLQSMVDEVVSETIEAAYRKGYNLRRPSQSGSSKLLAGVVGTAGLGSVLASEILDDEARKRRQN